MPDFLDLATRLTELDSSLFTGPAPASVYEIGDDLIYVVIPKTDPVSEFKCDVCGALHTPSLDGPALDVIRILDGRNRSLWFCSDRCLKAAMVADALTEE